jgi:hypothetical protein
MTTKQIDTNTKRSMGRPSFASLGKLTLAEEKFRETIATKYSDPAWPLCICGCKTPTAQRTGTYARGHGPEAQARGILEDIEAIAESMGLPKHGVEKISPQSITDHAHTGASRPCACGCKQPAMTFHVYALGHGPEAKATTTFSAWLKSIHEIDPSRLPSLAHIMPDSTLLKRELRSLSVALEPYRSNVP